MNPLSTHAHLFATPEGIFKIKSFGEIKPFTYHSLSAIEYGEFDDNWGKCTLIARPIEDMTDDERHQWESKKTYRVREDDYMPSPESFLYALSVGCLPMKFRHYFGDTVIDSRTLKTTA